MNNNHTRIRLITCCSLFVLLVGYFVTFYSFYPGLSVGFQGYVERSISGRLYWDYGNGFNDLDYIAVTLLSDNPEKDENLGAITVEASGLRNSNSRGDMVWLVLTEHDFKAGEYTIEGRHQWMHWITIKTDSKGRQLALFPGSRITLANRSKSANLKFFNTPDSGIVRIYSENGPERFYDAYGKNLRWQISQFLYQADIAGDITYVVDPHRRKNLTHVPLPHQRVKGLKFQPVKEDLIAAIRSFEELVIRPSGTRRDATSVTINSIKVNGKQVEFSSLDGKFNAGLRNDQLIFSDPGDYIRIGGPVNAFDIEYQANDDIVPFEVYADGSLFSAAVVNKKSDATYIIRGESEIDYRGLALKEIDVKDVTGLSHLFSVASDPDKSYVVDRLTDVKQRRFSGLLLSVQIITAALIAFVLYWLSSLSPFRESNCLKELALNVFFRKGRWFFWLLFVSGVTVNLLWLLADWPGGLTPDSVNAHKSVKELQITNHHPYLYSLFVLGLYNIYDAPLTVIFFQIITYNSLIAAFMYVLFQNGIRWWILFPLCLAVFLLIPVNLYNMTVWKDIPFTILVLFWAFFVTYCFYKKCYSGTKVSLSTIELILLALLFLALCTLRHNGIVYIAFVPVCLLFFSNISRLWVLKFTSLSAVLFFLYYFVIPPHVLYEKPESNDWAKQKFSLTVERAAKIKDKESGFYLENYLGDRVERFTASLGTSPKATTWYNDMNAPPQRWFSVDELRAEYKTQPKSATLRDLQQRLLETRNYNGFSKGRFIHWNSLFSLVALTLVFLLYRWLPVSALYSSFFLYQTAALFFIVWSRWRYMYFLYLGGVFLLFIVLMECVGKRKWKEKQLLGG